MKKTFYILTTIVSMTSFYFTMGRAQGAQHDNHPMHWQRFRARGIMDVNHVWGQIWNIGNISGSEYLRWPGSLGHDYIGSTHFFVGAKVIDLSSYKGKQVPYTFIPPDSANGEQEFPILSIASFPSMSVLDWPQLSSDRTHQQSWQPVPGFYNDGAFGWIGGISEDSNNDGKLAPEEDLNLNGRLDHSLEPPESLVKNLAISTDKRTWPEFWPGGSYVGDERPYYGRPPKTTIPGKRAGKWNGEYKAAEIADQEVLYRFDDHENDHTNDYWPEKYWPMKNSDGTPDTTRWHDGGIAGAGIEVENRTYAWFHPLAEDILISRYLVRNYSDYILNHVKPGMWVDIGVSGFNHADYIFVQYDDTSGIADEFEILYLWGDFPVNLKRGMMAFAVMETPSNAYNGLDDDFDGLIDESTYDGIDNDGDWRGFADIGLDRLGPEHENYPGPDADGSEGNGIWDSEDVNLNGILDSGEDKNYNNYRCSSIFFMHFDVLFDKILNMEFQSLSQHT